MNLREPWTTGWRRRGTLLGCAAGLLVAATSYADETAAEGRLVPTAATQEPAMQQPSSQQPGQDILDLPIERLAQQPVLVPALDQPLTSVARQESTVGDSPAAVFVITNEMIRRSGATSVAAALRMVPGLDVAQIDNANWAISSRGFNDRFANKMLVQVDGRTVYNPVFSRLLAERDSVTLLLSCGGRVLNRSVCFGPCR